MLSMCIVPIEIIQFLCFFACFVSKQLALLDQKATQYAGDDNR